MVDFCIASALSTKRACAKTKFPDFHWLFVLKFQITPWPLLNLFSPCKDVFKTITIKISNNKNNVLSNILFLTE